MSEKPNRTNDELDDVELLNREADERREFFTLEGLDPNRRETTYRVIPGSQALLRAWERWMATGIAVRLRGLFPHDQT